MTPEDKRLNQDVLRTAGPLKLYRIARTKYANLSGVGAAAYPGRWNVFGQEAIYTSTNRATPQLEYLAHTPKTLIPSNLSMMEIHLDRRGVRPFELVPSPEQGSWFVICPTIGFAKGLFAGVMPAKYANTIALAVPSVIAEEWNVVLFPQAYGFESRVSLKSVETFEFDRRLFPEHAVSEIP